MAVAVMFKCTPYISADFRLCLLYLLDLAEAVLPALLITQVKYRLQLLNQFFHLFVVRMTVFVVWIQLQTLANLTENRCDSIATVCQVL